MSYTKTVWRDGQAPAINAENLNKIENGIADACEKAESATGTAQGAMNAANSAKKQAEANATSISNMAEDIRRMQQSIPSIPDSLPNPSGLTITIGATAYKYDGSQPVDIQINNATGVSF